ncbi:hypothetical protein X975_06625, partial [Stegodyphus mimosarum]
MQNNRAIEDLSKKFNTILPSGSVNNVTRLENNATEDSNNRESCHICQQNHWTTECPYFPSNNNFQYHRQARNNYRRNFYRGNFINRRNRYNGQYAFTRDNTLQNSSRNRPQNRRYNTRTNNLN